MRLTSFTDYGLRMLMRLGSAPGQVFSTSELADEFGLSRHHLTKIMQKLARVGIVETRRGGGGGAALVRAPGEVRLGDIVRVLEDGKALVECFDTNGSCKIDGHCGLKRRLRVAEHAFLASLDQSTLADVVLPPVRGAA
ncbi:Rrf2 family transcriptional regulator [Sedimentitalea sp. XS_ASV28]|uniref:RrF2 family transcriptional regulator n=1 Tax=Sedimentitalea sp. XS_ASV28 TaxID=3241296 RepID=UPI003514B61C